MAQGHIVEAGGRQAFGLQRDMQGIAAVAAPGVMGGVLMASIGLLESIMGFSPEQTALVMTLYLALDGYGPACNVTGDGAIALIINRLFGNKAKATAE
jgi:Na+/H+-dicarboxylate symporter